MHSNGPGRNARQPMDIGRTFLLGLYQDKEAELDTEVAYVDQDEAVCPSVEELAQFLRGELDHEADLNVAHHLSVCEYCPESLALMDSTPTDIWPEQTPDWFGNSLE